MFDSEAHRKLDGVGLPPQVDVVEGAQEGPAVTVAPAERDDLGPALSLFALQRSTAVAACYTVYGLAPNPKPFALTVRGLEFFDGLGDLSLNVRCNACAQDSVVPWNGGGGRLPCSASTPLPFHTPPTLVHTLRLKRPIALFSCSVTQAVDSSASTAMYSGSTS
eukprot:364341-Chlamydomonas_euryale.AAC.6